MRTIALVAALLALAAGGPPDSYYVAVFGYNAHAGRLRPGESHTFATWARVRGGKIIETVDISWCPGHGGVRVAGEAVAGHNKTLAESLKDYNASPHRWCRLLRTDASFFAAAKSQRDGLVWYRALDRGTRPKAVNCIHACSDVAGPLETGSNVGAAAARLVADHFVTTRRARETNDVWVLEKLKKVR